MNRRGFLGAAATAIFVPRFGRFYREGSGQPWTADSVSVFTATGYQTVRWTEAQPPQTWATLPAWSSNGGAVTDDAVVRLIRQIHEATPATLDWPIHPRFL